MWTCPSCQADVEDQFEVCWGCGTTRDGVKDPNFVREEEGIMAAADLDKAPRAPAPTDLVTVATFLSPPEAHLLRERLEAEGIEAFVDDEISTNTFALNFTGGTKVDVDRKDLTRARE